MTTDLLTHIRNLNAKSAAWVAEDPKNRFAGGLVEDLAHWKDVNVTTPNELDHYLLTTELYDFHKSVYGFRPDYRHLKSLSVKELETLRDTISRDWAVIRREDALRNRIERKLRHARHVVWVAKKTVLLSHRSGFTIGELVGA